MSFNTHQDDSLLGWTQGHIPEDCNFNDLTLFIQLRTKDRNNTLSHISDMWCTWRTKAY